MVVYGDGASDCESCTTFHKLNLLNKTFFFQLTKSEATSCNSFKEIFVGSFRCPNLQRALTQKNAREDNIFF